MPEKQRFVMTYKNLFHLSVHRNKTAWVFSNCENTSLGLCIRFENDQFCLFGFSLCLFCLKFILLQTNYILDFCFPFKCVQKLQWWGNGHFVLDNQRRGETVKIISYPL